MDWEGAITCILRRRDDVFTFARIRRHFSYIMDEVIRNALDSLVGRGVVETDGIFYWCDPSMFKRGRGTIFSMNKTNIEWADYTVNPLIFDTVFTEKKGCPHCCPYCLVVKFPEIWTRKWEAGFFPERIKGRMKRATIFVESIGDLFHEDVPLERKVTVLERCAKLDDSNTICFLTKNAGGYKEVLDLMQDNFVLGFTMESDNYPRDFNNNAKLPHTRAEDFIRLDWRGDSFLSGEPLMKMNSKIYLSYIKRIMPDYMVFGLNSVKGIQIPEASYESFRFLVAKCRELGITVIIKKNMARWGVTPVIQKIKHAAKKQDAQDGFVMPKKRVIQKKLI